MFGACPEGAAVPEALCSSQTQIPAWACWTSLRKRRLDSVNPYDFPFLPFLVMPTHIRIDSCLYSVGVWGREGKAMCLLFLVTKNTPLVHWGKALALPTVSCCCVIHCKLVFPWNFWSPFLLWGNWTDLGSYLGIKVPLWTSSRLFCRLSLSYMKPDQNWD